MQPETKSPEPSGVDRCIKDGDANGFFENLANAKLSAEDAKEKIAQMAEARASEIWREDEARGMSDLDRNGQAYNLRNLAKTIRELKPPTP